MTKISEHFTLEEMWKSDVALRHSIDNTPPPYAIENLTAVANQILEPVRRHFGIPFTPRSGFRCSALNGLVNGSPASQHMTGEAVDFEITHKSNFEVAEWIRTAIDYDQLILEFYRSGSPNSGWIHCSFRNRNTNRRQALTYDGNNYLNSLIA